MANNVSQGADTLFLPTELYNKMTVTQRNTFIDISTKIPWWNSIYRAYAAIAWALVLKTKTPKQLVQIILNHAAQAEDPVRFYTTSEHGLPGLLLANLITYGHEWVGPGGVIEDLSHRNPPAVNPMFALGKTTDPNTILARALLSAPVTYAGNVTVDGPTADGIMATRTAFLTECLANPEFSDVAQNTIIMLCRTGLYTGPGSAVDMHSFKGKTFPESCNFLTGTGGDPGVID